MSCEQVLYTSSRADEAFLDALRKPALPEAPQQPFEVCIMYTSHHLSSLMSLKLRRTQALISCHHRH